MGGPRRNVGDTVVSKNGYHYTYVEGTDGKPVRIATAWLVGVRKFGRYPNKDETVRFLDGDRTNLSSNNIAYVDKMSKTKNVLERRRLDLMDRIRELQAELEEVEQDIEKLKAQ